MTSSSTLKMMAVGASETYVSFCETALWHIRGACIFATDNLMQLTTDMKEAENHLRHFILTWGHCLYEVRGNEKNNRTINRYHTRAMYVVWPFIASS